MPKFEAPWVKVGEMPAGGTKYVEREMQEDILLFPEAVRPWVLKRIKGNGLSPKENAAVDRELNVWWQDKYGFPFDLCAARAEVLRRKHFPQGEQKAFMLQQELLRALKSGRGDQVKELKKQYQAEFPEQIEGVEVLFGIIDFLEKQKAFDASKTRGERLPESERTNTFRDFTEYQFLFTHFIINAGQDREFLEDFWAVTETMAKDINCLKEMQKLRRSMVSQTAVYHILRELGEKPNLSHPREDAFNAIDLWANHKTAIQIKGWNEEEPALFESDHLVFPGAETNQHGHKSMFASLEYMRDKNYQFIGKVKQYGRVIKQNLKGYMMVVPYSKIDFVTGEPAKELVTFFEKQMKQLKV